jgi:hypothetical protein
MITRGDLFQTRHSSPSVFDRFDDFVVIQRVTFDGDIHVQRFNIDITDGNIEDLHTRTFPDDVGNLEARTAGPEPYQHRKAVVGCSRACREIGGVATGVRAEA